MRFSFLVSLLLLFSVSFSLAVPRTKKELSRGPLKISADVTLSTQKGKFIEAEGNVHVVYRMDSGDLLESYSDFARYEDETGFGKVWGSPRALWKPKEEGQEDTLLSADLIQVRIKQSELKAKGRVLVHRTSSTLSADEVTYFQAEKRLEAGGDRPLFTLGQQNQDIQISAEGITAWTESRRIEFNRQVRGLVTFK